MKVLIACERSGVVRRAFRALGHEAWSCDLEPADDGSMYHKQGDVLNILNNGWDMMIAHPPCTYLANSGVRWLYNKDKSRNEERWDNMQQGADFFRALLDADIPRICVENPIIHKHCRLPKPTQMRQPWQFGHGETKATCLWLKNLPPLQPTDIVDGREARIHKMPPSKDRGILRSVTYQGIANAMADQWGSL